MKAPSAEDLARALNYIEREFKHANKIDGEMWAEGLAFGRSLHRDEISEYLPAARDMLPQLTHAQWVDIAHRASYMKQRDGYAGFTR